MMSPLQDLSSAASPLTVPGGEFSRSNHDLGRLLNPRSIAITGVSPQPGNYGMRYLRCLAQAGFQGDVVPISSGIDQVDGFDAVPDLKQFKGLIDVLMIASRNTRVLEEMKTAVDVGVRDFVVVSGGFRESGPEGAELEEEVADYARTHGLRVLGPQALGYLNFVRSVALMPVLDPRLERLPAGHIGVVSQSGALGVLLVNRAMEQGTRFSYAVATGNQAVIDTVDVAEFLVRDPETKSIILLLEEITSAERLAAVAVEAAQRDKPLIVWKAGRSAKAAEVALTHSGSLTGDDTAFDAFCTAYGIVRAKGINELPAIAAVAASGRRPNGNRVGVVTISGGVSGLAADLGAEAGLEFPNPSPVTVDAINAVTRLATPANPFDLTGEATRRPELIDTAVGAFVADPAFDSIVVDLSTYTPSARDKMVEALISQAPTSTKPLVVGMWATRDDAAAIQRRRLFAAGVPFTESAEGWISALAALDHWQRLRSTLLGKLEGRDAIFVVDPAVASLVTAVESRDEHVMDAMESAQLLESCGFSQPRQMHALTAEEASAFSSSIECSVAVKAVAQGLAHKTDAGAVVLGVRTPTEVEEAFHTVVKAAGESVGASKVRGAVIQEMVGGQAELMLGMVRDPQFGPVITIASGGVFVEIIEDAVHAIPPLDESQVDSLLASLRIDRVLRGARGGPVLHRGSVKHAIASFSELVVSLPESVIAVDLNPLIVSEDDALVVDSLFIIRPPVHRRTWQSGRAIDA